MNKQNSKTVAVVTSTIGRPELALAIKSVQNQTYPCKHYVFVDGNIFCDKANSILAQFPNVVPIYLPMNTGKIVFSMEPLMLLQLFLLKKTLFVT